MTTPGGGRRELARGFAGVTAATWLANVLSYLLLLVAARRLGAGDYGHLVTLLNLLLIGSVPSFALQAVAARRVATGSAGRLLRATLVVGGLAGALLALLAPLLVRFLHLPDGAGVLLVALCLPAVAVQGMCQGVWQGRQGFRKLAATTFAGVAGRSGGGLVGLAIGGTAVWAVAAIAAGSLAAAATCLLQTPLPGVATGSAPRTDTPLLAMLVESAHAAHAYGAFLLLSTADLLLARHVLPPAAAAVYAAGSVLTKAALWLPQSVANVLFASLTDADRHRTVFLRATVAVAGLGVALALAARLLRSPVAAVVGGGHYPGLAPDVWLFAVLGSCLAVLQFALVAGLAVRSASVTALVWGAVALEAVLVLAVLDHPGVRSVVGTVALTNLGVAAVAVLLRHRLAAPTTPAPATVTSRTDRPIRQHGAPHQ